MLIGERVRLRAPEQEDIPTFLRWYNDPEVRQYLLMYAPLSKADEERWFETQLAADDQYVFVVEVRESREWVPIGNCGLHKIDWKNRMAEFGISIGEKVYWGQGFGTEATRVMLRFAFGELNLHRVQLDVYDFNERGIRSYEKAGFQHEGTRRQALFRGGQYHDVHLMSILQGEFTDLA